MRDGPDEVFHSQAGSVTAARFGVVFCSHIQPPVQPACMQELAEWQRPIMPDEPIGHLSIVFKPDRMESEVQDATRTYIQEFAPRTRAVATIIAAEGFKGSAARAMLSTLYLVVRISCPRKVFADPHEAADWTAEHFDPDTDVRRAERWLAEIVAAERAGSEPA